MIDKNRCHDLTATGTGEYTWYAAAKAAVNTLVVGVAREVAKEGIRINGLSPGLIDTEIHVPGRLDRIAPMVPVGRAGQPEEVAETVLYLLSDAASYMTGSDVLVDGGMVAVTPDASATR